MKIIFVTILSIMLLNCKQTEENKYNKDEIIFVVDMNTNESKSADDIAKFSEHTLRQLIKMNLIRLDGDFIIQTKKLF